MLGFGLAINHGQFGSLENAVRSLFADGTPGVWYDVSDLSTLFQDVAGTTPVTASGQTVALMLDKSQGLVRGAEEITTQDLAASPWASGGAFGNLNGATAVGDTLTTTGASGARRFRLACVPGQWFVATATTTGVAASAPQLALAFGDAGAVFSTIEYSSGSDAHPWLSKLSLRRHRTRHLLN
jgi:hypothetical protein